MCGVCVSYFQGNSQGQRRAMKQLCVFFLSKNFQLVNELIDKTITRNIHNSTYRHRNERENEMVLLVYGRMENDAFCKHTSHIHLNRFTAHFPVTTYLFCEICFVHKKNHLQTIQQIALHKYEEHIIKLSFRHCVRLSAYSCE